ncbi:MAG: hypothetical protein GW921_03570, partial [Gallionella sp.]|nr:hypothetical protein [Gallionella sp.]
MIPVFAIIYLFGKKIKDDSKKINLKLSIKIIIIPLIIALLSFFWSRHLMVNYLRDVPHVPDSISYVVLAKIISSGKFIFPYSEIPSYIRADQIKDFFYHWFQTNKTGLFVPYLIGHPLVLALGNLFGIINYIPPLVGSLTLLLIFFITYFLTQSVMFSLISMGLCFISPFFQTQTIDYLSHNSAVLFILFSIFPLFLNKESTKYFLLTGFFLGMLLNTRPLTFVAVFISIILYLIIEFIKDKKFKKFLLKLTYSLIGSITPGLIFLYYNFATSGNIFTTPYQFHGILNKVGFGSDFKIGYGLLNTFSNLAVFSLFFLKNYYVSFFPLLLSFLLLPFSGKYLKKILFLQFLSLSIIGVWTLYDGNFFMYGPRFIYESVPILGILYGLSFFVLYQVFRHTNWKYFSYLLFIFYFVFIFLFE